jgi:hypothetical protein
MTSQMMLAVPKNMEDINNIRHLNIALTVWARGKFINGWKDTKKVGSVLLMMCILDGH